MFIFTIVLIFNAAAMILTGMVALSRRTSLNKLIFVVAVIGFLLAFYQFQTCRFNPFVLVVASSLNILLLIWLSALRRNSSERQGKD